MKAGDIIEGVKVAEVLLEFPVLWIGWEMDNEGWIVKDAKGREHVVLTAYSIPYITSQLDLKDRLNCYKDAIDGIHQALKILNKPKKVKTQ